MNRDGRVSTRLSETSVDPVVMGILNVTPDSFSDGGMYLRPETALAHGRAMSAQGAGAIDVGGESSRPGARPIDTAREMARIEPVLAGLGRDFATPISIDTCKLEVARRAVELGASMVNDITALRAEPELADFCAGAEVDVCLMHMRGEPETMQDDPRYEDVVSEVKRFLEERMSFAVARGVREDRIVLDPGIGFGKTVEHNIELIARLGEIASLGRPVLVGVSRKRFIGGLTGAAEGDRLSGTIAANVAALGRGAKIFRVHDVAPAVVALKVASAIRAVGCRDSA